MKPRIQEAILVEGRYDRNTLLQIVDASVLECGGYSILHDPAKLSFLRRVAEHRGLVILLDSDGAGFVIRNRLKSLLPLDGVFHAYIPDIPGREHRKKAAKSGQLGVEGMPPKILLESLRRSGAHFSEEQNLPAGSLTRQDLYALGLMGCAGSAELREKIKKTLQLPANLSTNAFLDALNLISNREELFQLLQVEYSDQKT